MIRPWTRLSWCLLLLSCLLLPGCLTSEAPILVESADVTVDDLSGTYVSRITGDTVRVSKAGANRFLVHRGDNEPEEALLVPLAISGTYLMQFYDGQEYSLATILVTEEEIVISVFAAEVQGALGDAFEESDHFRKLAAALLANNLKAILEKHGVEVDEDYGLVNRPSAQTLIAFFNDCLRDPGTLTDSETLTKKK